MDWTERLRRKFGRYAIPHLMYYIAGGMLLLFLMSFALPGVVWRWFPLDMASVLHGQVWRLVTFAFLPPSTSLLFAIFSIYFYYFIGSSLESYWGSFRFNLFYLTGWIGTILGALITGYAVNTYLNFSLFLAFAMLAPDYQVTLFFFFQPLFFLFQISIYECQELFIFRYLYQLHRFPHFIGDLLFSRALP